MFDLDFEFEDEQGASHSIEEAHLEKIEPTDRDRRDAVELYRTTYACMSALQARNQDIQQRVGVVRGEVPVAESEPPSRFIPMETAAENFASILFTGLAPHIMRTLMSDPSDALRMMVEQGLRIGLAAGIALGSSGIEFSGITIPDLCEMDNPGPEKIEAHTKKIEEHAKKIAQYRAFENDAVCPCPKCNQIRDAVEKINELGVKATFQKIAGVASMEIDDDTVTTPELKHQVDEILGSISAKAAWDTEGPVTGTGMYL